MSVSVVIAWPSLTDKLYVEPIKKPDHTQLPIRCLLIVKPNLFCLLIKK